MPIVVSCPCGKKLRVKDELAGKRVKCPECAQVTTVPSSATPAASGKKPAEKKVVARKATATGNQPARVPGQAVTAKERPPDRKPQRPADEQPKKPSTGANSPTPFWVRADDLLVVSDEVLFFATLDEEKMQAAQDALKAGTPPEEVLQKPDLVISVNTITKVEGNLYHPFFDVKYKENEDAEESEKTIHCEDHDARDEIKDALRERLGGGWKEKVVEYSRLRATVEPLIVIAFFGFVTYCFYMAGAHPEDDKSSSGGKWVRTNFIGAIFIWVYNLLGPWGVVSVGGLTIGLGVLWLVARVIKPPIMFTLAPARPAPSKKARSRATKEDD
jgi:hypothetical protein